MKYGLNRQSLENENSIPGIENNIFGKNLNFEHVIPSNSNHNKRKVNKNGKRFLN